MSAEFLSYFWFFALALVWAIYVCQEAFITGGSIISIIDKNNYDRYKRTNSLLALHWDGIQVWLILAVGGLFAAFPDVYATVLSTLYIPFFLLLYAIIFRGIAIEVIYKTDSAKLQNVLKIVLAISSALIILVIGIYLMSNFTGLSIGADGGNTQFFSFLTIFSVTNVVGGALFVVYAIAQGTSFIKMNTESEFVEPFYKYARWCALAVPLFISAVFLAYSNIYDVFTRGLFADHLIYWILPLVSLLSALVAAYLFWLKKYASSFILNVIAMITFIFTGFVSMFPYAIVSTVDEKYGTLIVDGSAGPKTLEVMFYATIVFLPIVIGYQLFKYIRFWGKA